MSSVTFNKVLFALIICLSPFVAHSTAHAKLIFAGFQGETEEIEGGFMSVVRVDRPIFTDGLRTGHVSGTATFVQKRDFNSIRVNAFFSGYGRTEATTPYDFGTWTGPGYMRTPLNGRWLSDTRSTGEEFFWVEHNATTFSDNPGQQQVNVPEDRSSPYHFRETELKRGTYGGPGTQTLEFVWRSSESEIDSDFVIGSVPEPSTLLLLSMGLFLCAGAGIRKRSETA